MKGIFPIDKFQDIQTPFYYYDTKTLRETLNSVNREAGKYANFCVHYAVKANANDKILSVIRESGLGASLLYASPSQRDRTRARMPSSA